MIKIRKQVFSVMFGSYFYLRDVMLLLVIDFYQMWWLLKEPFLATYSAMFPNFKTEHVAKISEG